MIYAVVTSPAKMVLLIFIFSAEHLILSDIIDLTIDPKCIGSIVIVISKITELRS